MKFLAQMGKLIIIGRGGACATAHLPRGIHIRLVAPVAYRIRRLKERLGTSEAEAKRLLEDYDEERAKFVRTRFGKDIQDPLLYHATWNTEKTAFRDMSQWLIGMIKARAPRAALFQYDEAHSLRSTG
jgi:cytidylate kinase